MKRMWDWSFLKGSFPLIGSDGKINGTANGNVPIVAAADMGLSLSATVAKYGMAFIVGAAIPVLILLQDAGSSIYNATAIMPKTNNAGRSAISAGNIAASTLNSVDFSAVLPVNITVAGPAYTDVTSGAGWTGSVNYGVENDTLHIKGTLTVGSSQIASGSTLFTLPAGFQPSTQFTHGSAVNTGVGASATFSGVVITTGGAIINQAILAANTTYNICITCAK